MNAEYSRNGHGAIIKLTMDQISSYFDTVEGEIDRVEGCEHVACSRQLHGGEKQNFFLNM
jgi:hypothetical protein